MVSVYSVHDGVGIGVCVDVFVVVGGVVVVIVIVGVDSIVGAASVGFSKVNVETTVTTIKPALLRPNQTEPRETAPFFSVSGLGIG